MVKPQSKARITHIMAAFAMSGLMLVTACGNQAQTPEAVDRPATSETQSIDGGLSTGPDPQVVEAIEKLGAQNRELRDEIRQLRVDAENDNSGLMTIIVGLLAGLLAGGLAAFMLRGRKDTDTEMLPRQKFDTWRKAQDRQNADLSMRLSKLEDSIAALRQRPETASAPGADTSPAETSSGAATGAPAAAFGSGGLSSSENRYESVDVARNEAASAPQEPAPQPKRDIVEEVVAAFNNVSNPQDIQDFEAKYSVEHMNNNRGHEGARLFDDGHSRFWLVHDGGQPDTAYLIPGSDAKKNWHKFREGKSDHPFSYHFDLSSGDDLRLVRPALLRRQGEEWALVRKGFLEGIE